MHCLISGTLFGPVEFILHRNGAAETLRFVFVEHITDLTDASAVRHIVRVVVEHVQIFRWLLTMCPFRIFRQSTGFRPERCQWPVSAQEPMRGSRLLTTERM